MNAVTTAAAQTGEQRMNAITAAAAQELRELRPQLLASPSGSYVASPGTWGCGEGYRIQTVWAARSARPGRVIADVWTAEQAQLLLDALDAKDAIEGVRDELAQKTADYQLLAEIIDRPSLVQRVINRLRRR
jgi:hypothetical protein